MIRKGLGKGLGALIPLYEEDEEISENEKNIEKNAKNTQKTINFNENDAKIVELDINQVIVNPNQPRKDFNESTINELANSIKIHGVLQPIVVVAYDDKFMIVAGERRYRACKSINKETIPAIIKNFSDKEIKELALIENIQREDLNAIEVAKGLKQLISEYNFTQEKIAERLGMERSSVANYLRVLTLSTEVQSLIQHNKLSLGHAKVIAGIEDKDLQTKVANECVKHDLSVRKLEKLVKELKNPNTSNKLSTQKASLELTDLVKRLENCFGTKVSCLGNDTKGRIFIDYSSRDDLDRIHNILKILK